jgi:hypothetical protein
LKEVNWESMSRIRQWEVASGSVIYTSTPAYPPLSTAHVYFSRGAEVVFYETGVLSGGRTTERHYSLYDGRTGERICLLTLPKKGPVLGLQTTRPAIVTLHDDSLLSYDISHLIPAPPKPAPISETTARRLWDDLASNDIHTARAAVWALAAAPAQSLPLLAKRLQAVEPVPAKRLNTLIGELDNDDFETRSRASADLARLGLRADRAVRAAFAKTDSQEAKRRLQALIRRLDQPLMNQGDLRTLRAIEVLEHIGSDSARHVLRLLSAGALGAIETEEAKASLARLARKPRPSK